jgi:predicted HicB family RNase H-like nuclease
VKADFGLYTGNVVSVPSLTGGQTASNRISLVRTGEGSDASWLAEVDDLPDCSARGATPEEAVQRALAAAEGAISNGAAAAELQAEAAPRHSGKLLVRMPATLHDELARAAEAEGVSLNQLITGALASAVEWRSAGGGVRSSAPVGASDAGSRLPAGLMRYALVANLAVLLLATAVAIALLVVAWRAGF